MRPQTSATPTPTPPAHSTAQAATQEPSLSSPPSSCNKPIKGAIHGARTTISSSVPAPLHLQPPRTPRFNLACPSLISRHTHAHRTSYLFCDVSSFGQPPRAWAPAMAAAGLARSRAAMDINIPVAASLTASRAPARRRVPREAIAAKAHVDNELRPRAGQQQLGRRGANRDGEQEDDASVPRLGSNTILYRVRDCTHKGKQGAGPSLHARQFENTTCCLCVAGSCSVSAARHNRSPSPGSPLPHVARERAQLVPREGRGEAEAEKPGLGLKGLLAARASAKRATSSEGLQHKLASLGAALALAGLVRSAQQAWTGGSCMGTLIGLWVGWEGEVHCWRPQPQDGSHALPASCRCIHAGPNLLERVLPSSSSPPPPAGDVWPVGSRAAGAPVAVLHRRGRPRDILSAGILCG